MKESEAKMIAEAMVKAAEKSGEKMAQGIKEGLCEGFSKVAKSLHGTKAELMMDVLLKQSEVNGGNIPESGSETWNKSKGVARQVPKKFLHEDYKDPPKEPEVGWLIEVGHWKSVYLIYLTADRPASVNLCEKTFIGANHVDDTQHIQKMWPGQKCYIRSC